MAFHSNNKYISFDTNSCECESNTGAIMVIYVFQMNRKMDHCCECNEDVVLMRAILCHFILYRLWDWNVQSGDKRANVSWNI